MNESLMPELPVTDFLSVENQNLSHCPQSDFELLPTKRSKIWELRKASRCLIAGTCLFMDELVGFAQRYHFSLLLNGVFSLHIEVIDHIATQNSVSEAYKKAPRLKVSDLLGRF